MRHPVVFVQKGTPDTTCVKETSYCVVLCFLATHFSFRSSHQKASCKKWGLCQLLWWIYHDLLL